MFELRKTLTNSRPPKSDAKVLTTSPTLGSLRLSEPGAIHIGVKKGDFVGVAQGEDDVFYIYKGSKGTDGKANDGAKVATANDKASGTLNFSSANVYLSLGGNDNTTESYTIGEGVENGDKTYFPLTFKSSTEKVERVKKATV